MKTNLLCLLIVIASGAFAAQPEPFLISSFEPSEPGWVKPQGDAKVVKEHASVGEYAMQITASKSDYCGVTLDVAEPLKKFADYMFLRVDLYNPQENPVHFGVRIDDANSKGFATRFNWESVAAPGVSTLEINLTALMLSDAKGNTSRNRIDRSKITHFGLFMGPSGTPTVLYIDNLRLAPAEIQPMEGLHAFSLGPTQSAAYQGFEKCDQKCEYNDERGYGWIKPEPGLFENIYMPDPLGAYGGGGGFRVKLPNGSYEVQMCLDPFGIWGRFPSFTSRQVIINGKTVLDEKMNGQEFLDKIYYAFEDDEDLPGMDCWDKYVVPRCAVRHFTAEVTDGLLNVAVQSPDKHGKHLLYLVVYPSSKKDEGQKWMDNLNKVRHDKFNKWLIVHVPTQTGDDPAPTAEDTARGFIPFVRHSEQDIAVNARPAKSELNKTITFEAARGERDQAQFGLYPLTARDGVTVTMSDLAGPDGGSIPSSAIKARKIRNFLKHAGRSNLGDLLPFILMPFKTLDLKPGVTRGVWLTLTVPADAKPGKYSGTVTVGAQGKSAVLPLNVTVYPFTLDKVTDVSLGSTGSGSCAWSYFYPELNDKFWDFGEGVMRNLAEHGMNCIDGGANAKLIAVKDGKAEIDYKDMDRWLETAYKHGLTMPADDYGGLQISGMIWNSGKDCIAETEKQARAKFGISYPELVKAVYTNFDQHMKDKGWPKRLVHFLDEPRPEWSNIESAGELIKLAAAASPETLFCGYYSPGAGRDVYFQTMPVSIAHCDNHTLKLVSEAHKQLWEYNGSRVRFDIGRRTYVASRRGLTGFKRNGYLFVCSQPYFDFSDEEASWSEVFPSHDNGLNDTVGWERTANGVNDYRYMSTLERLIKKARTDKKATAEADAADAYLSEQVKSIDLDNHQSGNLTPEQFDEFKRTMAGHIATLAKALGE
jgi:hypothetical protein